MIPAWGTAAVLLCAGLSTRFGKGNKLMHPIGGKPMLAHAAGVLQAMPFRWRLAIVGNAPLAPDGFDSIRNPRPEEGQDSSLRIGLEAALDRGAEAALIALGDMPFVTAKHLEALLAAADQETAAMSSDGEWRSPPLVLPRLVCEAVLARPGDPVRAIVVAGRVAEVVAPVGTLRDFDTRADFDG